MSEELQTKQKSKEEKKELPVLPAGTIVCNNYKIVKKINTGGMDSVVYLVQSTIDNQYYAAKVIHRTETTTQTSWDAFRDELITTWRVRFCPNVVHSYADDRSGVDHLIFVMDYINGPSLREVLSQQNHLSVEETLYIFKKIAIALDSIHSFKHKIIHQDLKPENVMLSKDRSDVKIIDFGIANVLVEGKDKKYILTKKDAVNGTFAYINPDIVRSLYNAHIRKAENKMEIVNQVVNEQIDFYAFGVMLFETLMGRKPFYAADYNKQEVTELPMRYDIPIMSKENPKIPVILDNIVYRCMASKNKDIKNRYKSAKEIIADLEEAKSQLEQPKAVALIKPANERSFQPISQFNFQLEKKPEKFYSSKWFFFLTTFVFIVVVLAMIAVILFKVLN